MVLLIGAFVGPIYDRGYFRLLLIFGSFMIVFGHMVSIAARCSHVVDGMADGLLVDAQSVP